MKFTTFRQFLSLSFLLAGSASAQTVSSVQSGARPAGYDVVGPVYEAGSDALSADFQANALPTLTTYLDTQLGERKALEDVSGIALHPQVLNLTHETDVRVYFLGEGAGYHNTLGVELRQNSIPIQDRALIFPDASSTQSSYDAGSQSGTGRTASAPLLPGDFVDLGTVSAGTQLDFFLISNGANGGTDLYTADVNGNPDRIQHVVSFALPGSPYLMIGFEDLYGGGDRDFNDLVFAVDIGLENIEFLTTPEASSFLMAGLLALLCVFFSGRPRRGLHPGIAA